MMVSKRLMYAYIVFAVFVVKSVKNFQLDDHPRFVREVYENVDEGTGSNENQKAETTTAQYIESRFGFDHGLHHGHRFWPKSFHHPHHHPKPFQPNFDYPKPFENSRNPFLPPHDPCFNPNKQFVPTGDPFNHYHRKPWHGHGHHKHHDYSGSSSSGSDSGSYSGSSEENDYYDHYNRNQYNKNHMNNNNNNMNKNNIKNNNMNNNNDNMKDVPKTKPVVEEPTTTEYPKIDLRYRVNDE